ncbi:uncharacterized protein G2W53_002306 [Senna tora]|uniref:Uncharacterized protein n=1 Tax=Senna tora TaxID=362788 RepID=A0A835CL31_9FABA|nr:uncharacterized protein G2W53_002306 [Senna tora]
MTIDHPNPPGSASGLTCCHVN